MAVRSKVFSEHKFSAGIGPNGGSCYATGSVTEFAARAAKAGYLCWHTHRPVVGHLISPQQMTADWLLQRFYKAALKFALRRSPCCENCKATLPSAAISCSCEVIVNDELFEAVQQVSQ